MEIDRDEILNAVQSAVTMYVKDKEATFYACAIDAGSVYLNTVEHLNSKLENGGDAERLRWGTGDFKYGEIAELVDYEIYDEHYNMSPEEQKSSQYAKVVAEIVQLLDQERSRVFEGLTLADDFKVYAADHEY